MKFIRIRMKIFLAMIAATAVPLGITSTIIFYQVSRSIDDDQAFAKIRVEQDIKDRIEGFFEDLNETAYQIYSNSDLIETIALDKEFQTESRTYDTVKDIEQFFFDVYYQSRVKDIMGMYLLRNNGELLGNFFPTLHPSYEQAYYDDLLARVRNNGYRPLMLIHYKSEYGEPAIQFLYPVRYRGAPSGLLVIDLKEKTFRQQIERYNAFYRGEVALLSSGGVALYDTDPAKVGQALPPASPADHRTVQIKTTLDKSGWTLLYRYQIDPEQILYRNLAAAMIGVAALLAIFLSLGLSFNITKPIVHLHRNMGRIQIGDYDARVDVKTQDEIGFLGNQFNRMAEQIQRLVEHDLKLRLMNQETQIKALQAQISPHFLFNTLQMMAGIAEFNRVPDLKMICQSLSNMYRYNMDIDREWVRLRDEIMHIRNYLAIINKRYAGAIRFRLHTEPGASDWRIPKLILQPIVENAVEHGLIPGSRKRKLLRMSVRADRANGMLTIHILDNGAGIEDAASLALDSGLEPHATAVQRAQQDEQASIGLANVHARIRLICGPSCGLRLTSRRGVGTCVTFTLPLKEADE
ncbi:HAMP domain-containing protein [Cohnella sp. CFH 77786]|uniref:cache domain-containing sensor histidine kinase n=1 Tax=Cohnella sp. CFH 77786 TaxID=2662265 RepID=UPI001C60A736|nr:sensor histidine kinase [Cohnella sp. CFH 77786]MBW5447594.1 HAMP domain-containing protein [Cohnella sp. CFH 77786]